LPSRRSEEEIKESLVDAASPRPLRGVFILETDAAFSIACGEMPHAACPKASFERLRQLVEKARGVWQIASSPSIQENNI